MRLAPHFACPVAMGHPLRRHKVVFHKREEAEFWWRKAWSEIPQEEINSWLRDMPRLLQKVIDSEGGNDFHS